MKKTEKESTTLEKTPLMERIAIIIDHYGNSSRLGKKIGIHPSAISRIKSGVSADITAQTIIKLVEDGWSADWLLSGVGLSRLQLHSPDEIRAELSATIQKLRQRLSDEDEPIISLRTQLDILDILRYNMAKQLDIADAESESVYDEEINVTIAAEQSPEEIESGENAVESPNT